MSAQTSFWARRRAGIEAEAKAEARAQEAGDGPAPEPSHKDDATLLQELGLPDPDVMEQGSDFAGFMAKEVPEHLKNKALRVLWRSNPVLACVDGLNEYDDDYRAAMFAVEPIKTAYQVGKGMMAHVEEMARQQEASELVAEASEDDPQVAEETVQQTALEHQGNAETPQDVIEVAVEEASDTDGAPRRMRFRFEEATV